jgi:uncharacterized membrane protein
MMKSKKGSLFFGITIALFLYITGVLILPFIVDDVSTFRIGMSCSDPTISDGSKLTCLFGDLTIPYLIWFFISLAVGYLVGANK